MASENMGEDRERKQKVSIKRAQVIVYVWGWVISMQFKLQNFSSDFKRMQPECNQNSVANFVQKTYEILSNNEFGKIIVWSGNGKQFTIRDIEQFEETILPKYFRHRNINSFIRQLNMYGFHKSRKEPTKNIFSHPNFVKDKAELLQKVRRKIKLEEQGAIAKALDSDDEEVEEQPTPAKSEAIPSITSLPMRSSIYLEKDYSPLKSLISKSYILDINPEMCIRMRENCLVANELFRDDDDNISIEDQIDRQRRDFQTRTQGISIVKTCNFLDEFDF